MNYSDSSYFSLLLDAINTPPNFDLNDKSFESAELPNFSFRHTDLASCFPPVALHLSPTSSYSNLSNASSHSNELYTCLPSPTNSVIEVKNPSPLLQAHTVKSHTSEGGDCQFQAVNQQQQQQQQSILTTIETKSRGKKTISKKQKRINELPYAPNMLNLQLTPPPKNPISNSAPDCKKAPKIHLSSPSAHVLSSNSSLSPSSSSSSNKSSGAYRCDYPDCDKIFTRPYNLKSHRRTHTAEKPFDCPLCPKSFARQHDRNRHAKLHLGIKPYSCQFCTKSFARQDALNRHQRRDEASSPICARSIRAKKTKKQPSFTLPSSSSSVLSPPFVSSSLSSGAMLFSSCNL